MIGRIGLLIIFSCSLFHSQISETNYKILAINKTHSKALQDTVFLVSRNNKESIVSAGNVSKNTILFLNNKFPFYNSVNDKEDKFNLFAFDKVVELSPKNDSIALIQDFLTNNDSILVMKTEDDEFVSYDQQQRNEYKLFLYDVKRNSKLLSFIISKDRIYYTDSPFLGYKPDNLVFFTYTKRSSKGKKNFYYTAISDLGKKKVTIFDSLVICEIISNSCKTYPLKSVQFSDSVHLIYTFVNQTAKQITFTIKEYNCYSGKKRTLRTIKIPTFEHAFIHYYRLKDEDYFLTENRLFKINNKNQIEVMYKSDNLIFKDFVIE